MTIRDERPDCDCLTTEHCVGLSDLVRCRREAAILSANQNSTDDKQDSIPMRPTFVKALETAINSYSKENGSNTPDYILAEYLLACLKAFDGAVQTRAAWYGRMDVPGQEAPSAREPRVIAVIEAARLLSESLNGGFVRCMRCGDQEDTTDLDFAPELRKALSELDAIPPYVQDKG